MTKKRLNSSQNLSYLKILKRLAFWAKRRLGFSLLTYQIVNVGELSLKSQRHLKTNYSTRYNQTCRIPSMSLKISIMLERFRTSISQPKRLNPFPQFHLMTHTQLLEKASNQIDSDSLQIIVSKQGGSNWRLRTALRLVECKKQRRTASRQQVMRVSMKLTKQPTQALSQHPLTQTCQDHQALKTTRLWTNTTLQASTKVKCSSRLIKQLTKILLMSSESVFKILWQPIQW